MRSAASEQQNIQGVRWLWMIRAGCACGRYNGRDFGREPGMRAREGQAHMAALTATLGREAARVPMATARRQGAKSRDTPLRSAPDDSAPATHPHAHAPDTPPAPGAIGHADTATPARHSTTDTSPGHTSRPSSPNVHHPRRPC